MCTFLTREEIIDEQLRQLENYRGGFAGVISPGTLEAACYAPQATFGGQFLHEDVYAMAASYLVGFVMGHAFANGNKRIGLAAALEFLYVNGVVTKMSNDEAVALVLEVISGKQKSSNAAAFLRAHGRPHNNDQSLHAAVAWVHRAYAPAFEVLAQ